MLHISFSKAGPIAVAGVVALFLAACGGGSGDAGSDATPDAATATEAASTPTPEAMAPAESTPESSDSGSGAGAGAALGAGWCGDWGALAAQQAGLAAPSASGATPENMEEQFEAAASYFDALADNAPSEIRGDFEVFAEFWGNYMEVMAEADYDFMRIASDPELQQAMQSLDDPRLEEASNNIEAWVEQNC